MKSEFKEINGILPIDKEVGISSYDVIRRLKPDFPRKYKIGHAGTLDPFASGLLLILIGRGTKLSDELMRSKKEYIFTMEFGYETTTQDPEGDIVDKANTNKPIERILIEAQLEKIIGKQQQQPPIYSAKKVGGTSSYKLARKGKKPKLEPREIEIFSIELLEYEWPKVTIKAEVSSGTYIRTIAVDLARTLGSLATTTELRRTKAGEYNVENAFKSSLIGKENYHKFIVRIDE